MAATRTLRADDRVTGTDHAEQLAHLCTLLIMRKLAQSIQSICTAAAVTTWTAMSEQSRARSRRWNGRFDSGLKRGTADIVLVTGQAADEAVGEVRATDAFLRLTSYRQGTRPTNAQSVRYPTHPPCRTHA